MIMNTIEHMGKIYNPQQQLIRPFFDADNL